MIGLGRFDWIYTPRSTGALLITLTGVAKYTAGSGGGVWVRLMYQASQYQSAPTAGSSLTGNQLGVETQLFLSTNTEQVGFAFTWVGGTFPIGQQHWFDLAVRSASGTGAFVQTLSLTLVEL
jgi:hypothetical protein